MSERRVSARNMLSKRKWWKLREAEETGIYNRQFECINVNNILFVSWPLAQGYYHMVILHLFYIDFLLALETNKRKQVILSVDGRKTHKVVVWIILCVRFSDMILLRNGRICRRFVGNCVALCTKEKKHFFFPFLFFREIDMRYEQFTIFGQKFCE